MKRLTVLSGKGGVGKSSIAASLAVLLSEKHRVMCADCDVDASNLALVLGVRETDFLERKPVSTSKKAVLIDEKCTGCGACVNACYFDAIKWNRGKRQPEFNSMLCEGCNSCSIACPNKAIKLVEVKNATISYGKTKHGIEIVSGQLKMGESGSGKAVALVKKTAEEKGKNADFLVIDSAAGIGCPVIASVVGSDFVVAVTEPTPSGLSDLKRVLGVVSHFGIPYGIVINKFDINPETTRQIEEFAASQGSRILSRIPYRKAFVDALVQLKPVVEFDSGTRQFFEEILEKAGIK